MHNRGSMILNVKVVPNAKKSRIYEEQGILKVYVNAPPVEGEANRELVEALAEHFKVKKNRVEIIRGKTSRTKVVRIT